MYFKATSGAVNCQASRGVHCFVTPHFSCHARHVLLHSDLYTPRGRSTPKTGSRTSETDPARLEFGTERAPRPPAIERTESVQKELQLTRRIVPVRLDLHDIAPPLEEPNYRRRVGAEFGDNSASFGGSAPADSRRVAIDADQFSLTGVGCGTQPARRDQPGVIDQRSRGRLAARAPRPTNSGPHRTWARSSLNGNSGLERMICRGAARSARAAAPRAHRGSIERSGDRATPTSHDPPLLSEARHTPAEVTPSRTGRLATAMPSLPASSTRRLNRSSSRQRRWPRLRALAARTDRRSRRRRSCSAAPTCESRIDRRRGDNTARRTQVAPRTARLESTSRLTMRTPTSAVPT